MGLLDGGGAALLNSVFATIYPDGTLWIPSRSEDAGGSITETFAEQAIKVQTDRVTEQMRQTPGYTDADVRLIILSAGVSGITSDMQVTSRDPMTGGDQRWSVALVGVDPCGSHYECAGTRISG